MKRSHDMPFGAEYREDGSVRFCLWAPAAQRVDLSLQRQGRAVQLPLEKRADGWFELITDEAAPGTQYFLRIDDLKQVPDPASRFQPLDVHGPSEVIDSRAFEWRDTAWRGRRWEEAVIYELHVGTFTPQGTFAAARDRLDYLADLGVTAIELMPVADFPGQRNWGYDGVLPFAPDSVYGRPEDLKELIQRAHERGLMVFLDVVYNHFGPEGNFLRSYAPQFFTDRHCTPWGDAINFDGPESRTVRDFFIHNALYWLIEYHFDGLRLDAVHAIVDDSVPHILTELADTVRTSISDDRHVHLILENDRNQSHYLRRGERCGPRSYTAQWNDDVHHALHVLITSEREAYYADYAKCPLDQLGRCLTTGFAYQGEASAYRKGETRGEPTTGIPLMAFISFLQNHDQVGNRAFGERLSTIADPRALRAAATILLLAPSTPLFFMGEEFGAEQPFLFFCDFKDDLAAAVTAGRRNEFAHFAAFGDASRREQIPDPNALSTVAASRLDWSVLQQLRHQDVLAFYRQLLALRKEYVVPRLFPACAIKGDFQIQEGIGLTAHWEFADRSKLILLANLGPAPVAGLHPADAKLIYATDPDALDQRTLPAWSAAWLLKP
jgi:maltooligosyltrehalose trehalohydrolase